MKGSTIHNFNYFDLKGFLRFGRNDILGIFSIYPRMEQIHTFDTGET